MCAIYCCVPKKMGNPTAPTRKCRYTSGSAECQDAKVAAQMAPEGNHLARATHTIGDGVCNDVKTNATLIPKAVRALSLSNSPMPWFPF